MSLWKWFALSAILNVSTTKFVGRDSSVGIATSYGLDGLGIESRWGGGIFRNRPDRSWGPPRFLYNGYRVFPGSKAVGAWRSLPTTSSAEVKERVVIPPLPLRFFVACSSMNFTPTFTTKFNFKNRTSCPHSVFMCFVWLLEQTVTISLYSINWLDFITQTVCLLRGTD